MPKIIIREYDNTTAGSSEYANFSVLIPGLVKERTKKADNKWYYGGRKVSNIKDDAEIWNEDGIYEFDNQKDFEELIGFEGAKSQAIGAIACEPEDEPVTFEDDEASEEGEAETAAQKFATYVEENGNILYTAEPSKGKGHLDDGSASYKLISTWTDDLKGETLYVIEPGKEGADGYERIHCGNQIAYELLGLGYKVIYKKLTNLEDLDDNDYWSALKDKSNYDFRYILTGLLNGNESANEAIIKLAHFVNNQPENTGRGDCIALCDIDEVCYEGYSQATAISNIKDAINNNSNNTSKYAAYFAPYVVYNVDFKKKPWNTYNNAKFPASFHYLACAAKASEYYNEWYAIAGYTRGVCNYAINYVGCNFGELAVNALEPRFKAAKNGLKCAVNLVTKIKDSYYLWGNRTAEELISEDNGGDLKASHFLNIRQLCTTIKKQVYVTCKQRTFEPNSDLLWIRFCNDIRPLLEKMKADQGITDYKFIRVKTDKKALLVAKIRIVPIEAVEDFDISLTLEDSVSGIVTGIDEEEAE